MNIAVATSGRVDAAPVSRRRALGVRPRLARPARRARRRRARSRSRSATTCRNCWRASSPAAASRSTRSRRFLDPTVRRLMPDPHVAHRDGGGGARASPTRCVRGETVAIFGDYDVDGATSSALLARFLRHGGLEPIIHIPDRMFEGYGPNVEAIRALAERGATLLVTVDCGTTSIEPLAEARAARPRRHRHRPSPGRRDAAAGAARWSIPTGSTISPGSAISPRSAWCS